MKKANRVLKSEEFTRIIKERNFYATKGLVLYVSKAKSDHMRVGISVKKKVGNAVCRNKCKRQIRMMCQQIFDFNQPMDIIILIKEDFVKNSFDKNLKNLEKLYKKVKIN